jgi:hypothetical protein
MPPSGNTAYIAGYIDVYTRIHRLTAGAHVINATWFIRAVGNESMAWGNCTLHKPPAGSTGIFFSNCEQYSGVGVYGATQICDGSNATCISPTYSWGGAINESYKDNLRTCYPSGVCYNSTSSANLTNGNFSAATSATWSIHYGGFRASHSYWLHTIIEAFAYCGYTVTDAHLTPGVSGYAMINMATFGNGATLTSVVIT